MHLCYKDLQGVTHNILVAGSNVSLRFSLVWTRLKFYFYCFFQGGAGISAGSGGGSGGSLFLNATYFHGDGVIDVSGGDGNSATISAWHYRKYSQSFTGEKMLSIFIFHILM